MRAVRFPKYSHLLRKTVFKFYNVLRLSYNRSRKLNSHQQKKLYLISIQNSVYIANAAENFPLWYPFTVMPEECNCRDFSFPFDKGNKSQRNDHEITFDNSTDLFKSQRNKFGLSPLLVVDGISIKFSEAQSSVVKYVFVMRLKWSWFKLTNKEGKFPNFDLLLNNK